MKEDRPMKEMISRKSLSREITIDSEITRISSWFNNIKIINFFINEFGSPFLIFYFYVFFLLLFKFDHF
jgi:hypothetical protein